MYSVIILLVKRIVRRPHSFSVRGENPQHRFSLPRQKQDILPFVIRRYGTNDESSGSRTEKLSCSNTINTEINIGQSAKALLRRAERTGNKPSPVRDHRVSAVASCQMPVETMRESSVFGSSVYERRQSRPPSREMSWTDSLRRESRPVPSYLARREAPLR